MSYTTAEAKLRILAKADASLQAVFGAPPNAFRWFDTQEVPNYITQGPCVRVLRVSTVRPYSMAGIQNLSQPRFQFDVLARDAETSRQAAASLIDWLGTISLAENNQFASPPTTPPQFPCFVLNQRGGMEPGTTTPVWCQSLDVRIYNLEN